MMMMMMMMMTNLKFSEIEFKLPWDRNAHNMTESRKFLY